MKTHDLAKVLSQLVKLLRDGPNVELEHLGDILARSLGGDISGRIAVNLSTLVELSRIDRKQWRAIISEHGFPIEIRQRDASRDILGKLLRYLEENPSARERLRASVAKRAGQASPELMRALDVLLRN